ncbi:TRAP transporter substrate-binding protein [Limibaculum sp. FT325]|uniref:TRAP transporter substrate-binding protein n=1 Tax=Thermohalobaculum sediminis TaxID=2939436 RepID=UPI0020BF6BC8|nr:TRAP transporter substrate-binding protein [Limibaculum sediminis]MCL5775750.1 TRAP transporter substrate-binding protein [Limibaculum sediminis]
MPSRALTTAAAILATAILPPSAPARAAEANLSFAHFMPATSWQNTGLFEAWAAEVEAASGQRIDVTVFPAQTLGKAPQGYDNARDGIADIAWTVQGYTAGRFPLSQIVELPGLFETAEIGSCAFQKLYDSGALDAEYAETHVLFVHTHGPGHLHTRTQPVTTLADLKGLQIRHPTAVIGRLLEQLGAVPVGMPAPRIYEAAERGTIDGFMLPWEAVAGFRADEVSDHHTEFGFYALAFVATMNKGAYERLPDDLRAVVDANSGMKWTLAAGRGYDAGDVTGREQTLASGTLHQIEGAERAAWQAAADRAAAAYIAELDAQGLPGSATYEAVKGYVAACKTELGG